MKIAFISYDFPEYCIRHVNEMADSSQVLLMLPESTAANYLNLLDSRIRFDSFHRPRYRQPMRQLRTMAQIVYTIRKFKPDVVHFQNGHFFFNLALPLVKKFPLVISIHDARQHLGDKEARLTPQAIMDFGFKQADRVIVHGRSLIPTVVQELGFAPEKVHLIPHIAIGQTDLPHPSSDDGLTVLFFGRIWEYKGLEYLIRAEPRVSKAFPDVKFVIAGRGDAFDRYRRMMVHPERFVVHNDWISDDLSSEMFASASVVVLPYIEASQSGVIPIAYNHEKPVIATTVGGLPDIVDDGVTGLLVPPRDEIALAEAIVKLLQDKDARIRMGKAGREKLERENAPPVVVQSTMEVYRNAIRDRGYDVPDSRHTPIQRDLRSQEMPKC